MSISSGIWRSFLLAAALLAACSHTQPSHAPEASAFHAQAKADALPSPVPTNAVAIFCQGFAGSSRSPDALKPFVTWCANPAPKNLAAVRSAGLKTYQYTNFGIEYPCSGCSALYGWVSSAPAAQAKTCAGQVVTKVNSPSSGTGFVTDQTYAPLYHQWASRFSNGYDAVFADDSTGVTPYSASATPCSVAQWPAAIAAGVSSVLGARGIIYNNLGAGDNTASYTILANTNGTWKAAEFESCYASSAGWYGMKTPGAVPQRFWTATENVEIYAAQHGFTFWCATTDITDGSAALSARIFTIASWLLTHDGPAVIQERFNEGAVDGYNWVDPLYAVTVSQPLTAVNSVSDLAVNGLYARRFEYCGGPIQAACAIVVNPDVMPHGFPYTGYAHTVSASGGSQFDGGAVVIGPAPAASVQPQSAVIAF
jgi:hypothetical protein